VAIWRVAPPGGRGRTIAAIVAHMQGVRRTFARLAGLRPGPPRLDKERVTPAEAGRALRQSTDDLAGLFETALAAGRARVKGMPRRAVDMLTYPVKGAPRYRASLALDWSGQRRFAALRAAGPSCGPAACTEFAFGSHNGPRQHNAHHRGQISLIARALGY
jgi:uncharacterized damage-inducible protein DinB